MLTFSLKCEECGSDDTRLVCQQDRGLRGRVRLMVHCEAHGGWSHTLKHGPMQVAVKAMLDRRIAHQEVEA